MAKSIHEPKKIVRYSNNIEILQGGLSGVKPPALKPSATRAPSKVNSIPASAAAVSNTPPAPVAPPVVINPTPPPPTPETKAFSFDGSTFLTGSYPATLGRQPFSTSLCSVTIAPAWSNTTTGSFAIYSISNVDGDDNEGFNCYVERTYDGANYHEYLGTEYTKNSILRASRRPLLNTLASGSTLHLQFSTYAGGISQVKENNTLNTNRNIGYGFGATATLQGQAYTNVNTGSFKITVGGRSSFAHASGSQSSDFQGTMSNFMIKTPFNGFASSPVTSIQYNDPATLVAYKFEGTVSASVGGSDLHVVGTESYIDYA